MWLGRPFLFRLSRSEFVWLGRPFDLFRLSRSEFVWLGRPFLFSTEQVRVCVVRTSVFSGVEQIYCKRVYINDSVAPMCIYDLWDVLSLMAL